METTVYRKRVLITYIIASLMVGFGIGWKMSDFDKLSNTEHIQGWTILSKDVAFNGMCGEDQIEIIITYVAEGADPRPAWPLVMSMLNTAYSDIYANGFVDCQEECEVAIDQIHNAYALMEE